MKAGVRVRLPPTAAGTALAIAAGELAPCFGAVRCARNPPLTTDHEPKPLLAAHAALWGGGLLCK